MPPNANKSQSAESQSIQPFHEVFEIILNNKGWTALAVACAADGVFAIIDLSIKPGCLTTCSIPSDLKSCQLSPLGIAHVLGWTLIPPVFFFAETMIKRSSLTLTGDPVQDASRKIEADRLKAMQEMGGKIWAAVLAAILFLAPK